MIQIFVMILGTILSGVALTIGCRMVPPQSEVGRWAIFFGISIWTIWVVVLPICVELTFRVSWTMVGIMILLLTLGLKGLMEWFLPMFVFYEMVEVDDDPNEPN